MEVILYIIAGLIGLGGIFLLIEYPYYFIGVFIFVTYYQFNIELPGPLDLRGWLTIILFFRLIVFDKDNIRLFTNILLREPAFILILIFEIYFISVTYGNTGSYLLPMRLFVFQMIGLLLGFLAVYRGYAKETFLIVIIFTGILSTIDLTYSFAISSRLFVMKVLDVLIKSQYETELNHNFFGMLNGIALVTVYVMLVAKQIKVSKGMLLVMIFGVGLLLSTSRGTLVTVFVTLIFGTIVLPSEHIDVKKILKTAVAGVALGTVILSSYFLVLSTLDVDSEFIDKVYYRFVEEPMGLLEGRTSSFRGGSNLQQSTINWRINKAIRDINEFSKLNFVQQLFGFGYNGYYKIGEVGFDPWGFQYQIASHNGIATIVIERGILGLVLFYILNILLVKMSIASFRKDISILPFFIILININLLYNTKTDYFCQSCKKF